MRSLRASLSLAILLLVQSGLWAAEYRDNWGMITENGPRGHNTAVAFGSKIFAIETPWDLFEESYTHGGELLSSVDGLAWQQTPLPWSNHDGDAKLIVFQNQLWALIERQGKNLEIWHSADASKWTQLSSTAAPPSRADFGVAVFKDKLWITGGYDGNDSLDDIWSSADGTSWTLEAKGEQVAWVTRAGHACVVFHDRLWVIGGRYVSAESHSGFSDIWSSADGRTWIKESEMNQRRGGCSAVVTNLGLMVYGGEAYFSYYSDYELSLYSGTSTSSLIYSSDGKHWTEAPEPLLGARQGHSCLVKSGRIFIIGGDHWHDMDPGDHLESHSNVWATPDPRYDAVAVTSPLSWRLPRTNHQTVKLNVRNIGQSAWQGGTAGVAIKFISGARDSWDSPSDTVTLTTGTVVAPGATGSFTIPLDMSLLWNPETIIVQMYHPQMGCFGDHYTLYLDFIPDNPLAWREVPLPSDVVGMANPKLVSDGSRLWMNYRYSPDGGVSWVRAAGTVNTPWRPSGLEETANMTYFKGKLWVLKSDGVWSSSDGMTWTCVLNKAPWPKLDWQYYDTDSVHTYSPQVRWCCEHNGALFALIHYDLFEHGWDYSDMNCIWSSADGVNWKKIGIMDNVHAPGPMLSFTGKLRIFGGFVLHKGWSQYYDYVLFEDWYGDCYSSPTGKDWSQEEGWLPASDWTLRTVIYRNKVWALQPRGNSDDDVFESSDAVNWRPSNDLPCPEGIALLSACVHDDKIYAAFGQPSPTVEGRMYLTNLWCGSAEAMSAAVSSTTLDFGRREILSGPSAPKAVMVYNNGLAPLTFTGKGIELFSGRPGEFAFADPPELSPIGSGGLRAVSIVFNPALQGPSSATLRITTADPKRPTIDVRLLGEGFSPLPLRSGDVLAYLLGRSSNPTGLDHNSDGLINIADLLQAKATQVQITWPPQGETLTLGTKYAIRWKADSRIARLKLTLARDHLPIRTLADATLNDGRFDWTIPTDLVPGANYTILAADAAAPATQGESPAWFSITGEGAYLSVLYPGGGEFFARGEKVPLRWSNISNGLITRIKIDLYKGDALYQTLAPALAAAAGDVFLWTVPAGVPSGRDYRLVVSDADRPTRRAAAAGPFTIR